MTTDDQIVDEKLQYDINREVAKISDLSSGKIEKYEYLTGEVILPYNQKQIIEQAKFTYSPIGKAFEKKRLDNTTELDEKVNTDDLIDKYQGHTADAKFDKVDNALSLKDKIKEHEIMPKMIK